MPFIPALAAIASVIGSAVAGAAFFASDVLVPAVLGGVLNGGALAGVSGLAFGAVTASAELGALAGVSALTAPRPKVNTAGSPQAFKPDPNAPVPIIMGRYGVGGNLVYETTSGGGNKAEAGAKGNEYLTSFVILGGLGPYQVFETLRFNDTILTFDPDGQACNGGYIPYDEVQFWNPGYRHQNSDGSYINNNYQDRAWQNIQLGALDAGYFSPPSKLASDNAGLPEWSAPNHGFSGLCAASLTLVYDQRYYAGGVPQYQWVVQGQKLYDPRKDSTYPGGSGSHRWAGAGASAATIIAARATWEWTDNPYLHALNFALGHFLPDATTQLGRLYAGIGAGPSGTAIPAFVAAANVADANDWKICGQWTTGDGKWSVLTEMLKAGSGAPVVDRGLISCTVDTPKTSLGTITADDLSGAVTLPTGSSFTARINTIFPRFTSEAHRWQMVQADTPVKAATYVAEDGGVRSKTIDWQFVPEVNQACQLAAYTITNGREIAGIELPGKPKLRNYDVGDCLTVDIPEAGLATTKVVVTKRATDWSTGGVTLTVRTETDAKHAYSLGVSGVAPATPGISGYDPTIVEAPLPDFWATGALEVTDPTTGESRVVIRVTGSADDNVYAQTAILRWRPVALVSGEWAPTGDGSWSYRSFPASQGQFDLDLNPGSYDVQIAYVTVNGAYPAADEDWLDLGIETIGGSTSSATASVPDSASVGSGGSTMGQTLADLLNALTRIGVAEGEIAELQADGGAGSDQAAQQAAAAAEAAEAAAQDAEGQAQTYAGQAEGYANSAETQSGLATEAANGAAQSAEQATSAAGSAQGSATAASSAMLEAQVSGAATLPSSMAVPGFFTPDEDVFPGTPFPASDPQFVTASDGTPVFRTQPELAFAVCSYGDWTPVVERTYSVTATARITQAPTNGRPAILQAGVLGKLSDETGVVGVYADALDVSGTPVGQLITSTVVWTYSGLTPQGACKSRVLINYDGADGDTETGVFSDAVFELISLQFDDVTESAAAARSASAASTSESGAQAAEDAAGNFTSQAQTAQTEAAQAAGDAGTSAGAASGSAYTAQADAGDAATSASAAQAYALSAEAQAGDATSQAGVAQAYAAAANGSASDAQASATLSAEYTQGSNPNLCVDGGFAYGLEYWRAAPGWSVVDGVWGRWVEFDGASGTIVLAGQPFAVSAGIDYTITGDCGLLGSSAGSVFFDLLFYANLSDAQAVNGNYSEDGPQSPLSVNRDFSALVDNRQAQAITCPSPITGYAVPRFVGFGVAGAGAVIRCRQIKAEMGAIATAFGDNSTALTAAAQISETQQAAASATGAVAQRATTLEATVFGGGPESNTGLSASVTENAVAIADLNGQVIGMLKFSVDAGGNVVSLELLSASGGSQAVSAIKLTAEQLLLTTPDGRLILGVDGETGTTFVQNLQVNGQLLDSNSVDTPQIAQYATSQNWEFDNYPSSNIGLGARNSAPHSVCTMTETVSGHPLRIDCNVGIANMSSNHDQDLQFTMYIDSTLVKTYSGKVIQNSASITGGSKAEFSTFFRRTGVGAGAHTFTLYAQLLAGSDNETSAYVGTISVTEFKDQ